MSNTNEVKVGAPPAIGMFTWDVQSDRVFPRPIAAAYMFLMFDEAVKGVPLVRFIAAVHEDDRQALDEAFASSLGVGGLFKRTARISGDEDGAHIHITGFCFKTSEGTPTSFVGNITRTDKAITASLEDQMIDHCIEAYRIAGYTGRPYISFLLSHALVEMGFDLVQRGPEDSDSRH